MVDGGLVEPSCAAERGKNTKPSPPVAAATAREEEHVQQLTQKLLHNIEGAPQGTSPGDLNSRGFESPRGPAVGPAVSSIQAEQGDRTSPSSPTGKLSSASTPEKAETGQREARRNRPKATLQDDSSAETPPDDVSRSSSRSSVRSARLDDLAEKLIQIQQEQKQMREEQKQEQQQMLQMMHQQMLQALQMMHSNTPPTPREDPTIQDSKPQAQAPPLQHSKTQLEQNAKEPKQKGGSSVKQEPTTNDGELSDGEQRKLLKKLGIDIPLEQLKQLRDVKNLTLDTAKLRQLVAQEAELQKTNATCTKLQDQLQGAKQREETARKQVVDGKANALTVQRLEKELETADKENRALQKEWTEKLTSLQNALLQKQQQVVDLTTSSTLPQNKLRLCEEELRQKQEALQQADEDLQAAGVQQSAHQEAERHLEQALQHQGFFIPKMDANIQELQSDIWRLNNTLYLQAVSNPQGTLDHPAPVKLSVVGGTGNGAKKIRFKEDTVDEEERPTPTKVSEEDRQRAENFQRAIEAINGGWEESCNAQKAQIAELLEEVHLRREKNLTGSRGGSIADGLREELIDNLQRQQTQLYFKDKEDGLLTSSPTVRGRELIVKAGNAITKVDKALDTINSQLMSFNSPGGDNIPRNTIVQDTPDRPFPGTPGTRIFSCDALGKHRVPQTPNLAPTPYNTRNDFSVQDVPIIQGQGNHNAHLHTQLQQPNTELQAELQKANFTNTQLQAQLQGLKQREGNARKQLADNTTHITTLNRLEKELETSHKDKHALQTANKTLFDTKNQTESAFNHMNTDRVWDYRYRHRFKES